MRNLIHRWILFLDKFPNNRFKFCKKVNLQNIKYQVFAANDPESPSLLNIENWKSRARPETNTIIPAICLIEIKNASLPNSILFIWLFFLFLAKISFFYSVFYGVLAALVAVCMLVFLRTLDPRIPKWQLHESLIGTNPGTNDLFIF